MEKQALIQLLHKRRLLAVARGLDPHTVLPVANALLAGGITCMELPFCREDDPNPPACIRLLTEQLGDALQVGVGTVMTEKQVSIAAQAGASFVLSPHVSLPVIQATNRLGLVSIPGALTPTEIVQAYEAGADFVKLFPADALGPAYLQAVHIPLAHVPVIAMGGITPENLISYRQAGACAFGIGSRLIHPEWVASGQFDRITEAARQYVDFLNHS